MPAFLRTHPVTTTRISEAKDRAVQIAHETQGKADPPTAADHEAFLLFRERTRVLAADDPLDALRYYERTIDADEKPSVSVTYGLALARIRAGHAREAVAPLQALVDAQHRLFVGAVAKGRGMRVDRVNDLADGRVFVGAAAKAAGLVDRIGTLEEVLAQAAARVGPAGLRADEAYMSYKRWRSGVPESA